MMLGLNKFGLTVNQQKSFCWSVPHWQNEDEFDNYNDVYPMFHRIPYRSSYKYLGINTNNAVRRDVSWESAIAKAKRLEGVLIAGTKGTIPQILLAAINGTIIYKRFPKQELSLISQKASINGYLNY